MRPARLAYGATVCCAFALAACDQKGTDPAPPGGASQAFLQHVVDSATLAMHVPGTVTLVRVAGGSEYVITSGVDNIALGTAMSADDRFRVGSITKTMVSTVVLQLADENKLALGDTLARWFPGIVTSANRITVRELLNHTSGVPDYTDNPAFSAALAANPGRLWSPMELVALGNAGTSLFSPGTSGRWQYSNTNYILLGLIIEQVTGSTVRDELQHRILDRLQLTNTFFATTTSTPAPFSRGYVDVGGQSGIDVASLVDPSSAGAAGAIVSTAHDLATLAEALASGILLTPARQAQRLILVPASGGEEYALGVQYAGSWVGHAGQFPGYEAVVFTRPDVGTIVVLANKSSNAGIGAFSLFAELRWVEFGFR